MQMAYQLAGLLALGHLGVELILGVARDHGPLRGCHSSPSLLPIPAPRWDQKLASDAD